LSITAWEAFIEDALRITFETRLSKAVTPADVNGAFRAIAAEWLNSRTGDKPKPDDLIRWTGDKWKEILNRRFAK
jgi:hypothetical protein